MTMVMMTAMTIAMMMTTVLMLVMMMTTIKCPTGIGVGNQHQIHRLPVLGTTRNWSVAY